MRNRMAMRLSGTALIIDEGEYVMLDIVDIVERNEEIIKEEIKKLMDQPETSYPIQVFVRPETGELEFRQDDGSWIKDDPRILLFTIEPGISIEDYSRLMELEGKADGDRISLLELKDESAIDFLNDLVNTQYDIYYQEVLKEHKITITDIRSVTGLNMTKFAERYEIPYRTLQDWEAGKSKPPEYVRVLLKRVVEQEFEREKA